MSEITSRPAEATKEDCEAIFKLLLMMHTEVGRHTINPNKAFQELYTCIADGAAYMVYRDGELVASAGLRPMIPWYSDEEVFCDQWFYVRKDCRSDGRLLRALIKEAQGLANDTGVGVQLKIYDPDRPPRSKTTAVAEDFFFKPIGKSRVIWPAAYKVA